MLVCGRSRIQLRNQFCKCLDSAILVGGDKVSYLKIKRTLDFIFSFIGIIVLIPFFGFISILIKMESPGPILFKQKRVGIHKQHFNILKFRTMRIDTPKDSPTHLLENPEYWITRVGKFLRKTSLDEIPQIFNILKGEMSFVGPRPALWNQFDLIEEREKYGANDVPVGLTGWAQINGRDELEIDVKAKLDGEYSKNIGILLDMRCFFATIFRVLRSEGVVEGGTGKRDLQ
jgi:O-antigen biosynthesis protein WbqP